MRTKKIDPRPMTKRWCVHCGKSMMTTAPNRLYHKECLRIVTNQKARVWRERAKIKCAMAMKEGRHCAFCTWRFSLEFADEAMTILVCPNHRLAFWHGDLKLRDLLEEKRKYLEWVAEMQDRNPIG
jgi:hypothetical protein